MTLHVRTIFVRPFSKLHQNDLFNRSVSHIRAPTQIDRVSISCAMTLCFN